MANGIDNKTRYPFNDTNYKTYSYMYYTASKAKTILETWYQNNIVENGYSTNVATGNYFCEEARVKYTSSSTSGSATMKVYNDTSYEPTFSCGQDGNEKGMVNANVGLITYDEALYAGAYCEKDNNNYYLYHGVIFWTMSPAGVNTSGYANLWYISSTGHLRSSHADGTASLRPVINLKADTPVELDETGTAVWKVVE